VDPVLPRTAACVPWQLPRFRFLGVVRDVGRVPLWLEYLVQISSGEAAAPKGTHHVDEEPFFVRARPNPLEFDGPGAVFRLFELLPMMPRFTVEKARQQLETSIPTANAAVKLITELGIVTEMTGQRKNRTFGYQNYIELLARSG
jgi:hypothetical protein